MSPVERRRAGGAPLQALALAVAVLLLPAVFQRLWSGGGVLLVGSGATFPQEQIAAWADLFSGEHPGVHIEYAGGGSGRGLSDFLLGVADFACSDVPMSTKIWEKARREFGGVYQLPWVGGGIAVVYNVPEAGEKPLRLSRSALVDILLGEIEYWDDPRLVELNPELKLPHERIIFVHRSDASGTTYVFTSYLSKISEEWKTRVGRGFTVEWPLDKLGRGVGAQGNAGVAEAVKSTPHSLGYVELAYTEGLQAAELENAVGEYVAPSVEAVARALEAAQVSFDPSDDLSKYSILDSCLDVEVSGAYPIASVSFIVVRAPQAYPPEKARALSLFLEWVFTRGQAPGVVVKGYVPLGGVFAEKGLEVARALRRH